MNVDADGVVVTPFLRSAYNYDADSVSRETGLLCEEPTLTKQEFAEEVDINTIVERFGVTGEMPQNVRVPLTSEFVETMDYRTSIDKIREADDAFMQFPAKIRAEFENDAAKFVAFVSDPANVDKVREWGLANPLPTASPPVEVIVRNGTLEASGPGST